MDNIVIGNEQVKEAYQILQEYKQGKQTIDERATENQEWWRLRHCNYDKGTNESAALDEKPVSAWLFNSVINKHADIMDNYPKPNILPRAGDDEDEAQMLSKIVPVIFEQNDYEEVYSQKGYDLIIEGGCATSILWDSSKNNGMGDIAIKNADVHNLFWQPGKENIQESANFFSVKLQDVDSLKSQFPEVAERISAYNSGTTAEYIHDDNINTENDVEVIDWYYKKTIMQDIVDEEGNVALSIPKTILHYCKFACDEVLFASENHPEYANGYYNHGMYPYVIRPLFPIKDSAWGFGFIDVMKSPQKYIDRLDQAILRGALIASNPRYWAKKNADIDMTKFTDLNNQIVEVASGDLGEAVRPMEMPNIPAFVVNQRDSKIEELKETSGNRDFSQGSTQSGVTAASAIAALQEAGSKLARDVNKIGYRSYRDETYLVVELVRQFYTEPREFRVDDENGKYSFEQYTSTGKSAVFDIKITAEKQSPFSRAAQNETAKEMYGLGWFNPQMAEQALVSIDMMEFEGKDKIKQQIKDNSLLMQQVQAMMQVIMQADAMFPDLQLAAKAGLAEPQQMAPAPQGGGEQPQGTAEERAARKETDTTLTAKARMKAAQQASV